MVNSGRTRTDPCQTTLEIYWDIESTFSINRSHEITVNSDLTALILKTPSSFSKWVLNLISGKLIHGNFMGTYSAFFKNFEDYRVETQTIFWKTHPITDFGILGTWMRLISGKLIRKRKLSGEKIFHHFFIKTHEIRMDVFSWNRSGRLPSELKFRKNFGMNFPGFANKG